MITHEQFKKEFLSDPANREAYESLEVEYKLYDALIKARIQNKLTQKELAKKLGIAQSALARFESGRTNPTLSFIQKIASGLGLKLKVV